MQPSLTAYDFACTMQAHWTKNLHNVSSPKLMSLWTVMGQTFLGAIDASKNPNSPDRHLWRVLRPETGVGKAQGVRIFSAMVAARNLQVAPEERIGVLIVTRQTDEADRLAAEINQTFTEMQEWGVDTVSIVQSRPPVSPPQVAVARHSKPTGRSSLGRQSGRLTSSS